MRHFSSKVSCLVLTFSITLVVVMLDQNNVHHVEARAYFVFGDSLVDNGNNNFLLTSARADSPPYGIDSPSGRPSGRFSNSRNLADLVGERIGVAQVLPYLNPQLDGERLLEGANFASAGVGILNDTGIQFVNIIRIVRQLQYFQQYQSRVGALIGEDQTRQLVNDAMVLITLGGNDFVNNYFLIPFSARSRQYRLPDYVRYLIQEYRKILLILYELGARRVIVTGTGPIGCVPAEIAQRGRNGECAVELQQAAGLFNPQLVQIIQELNSELGSDVFISANAFEMSYTFITNPAAFGFVTSKVACCGQGPFNGIGLCTVISNLCPNRDLYAFWDAFHPSDRANQFIVEQFMIGSNKVMNPMNLSTMLTLDSRT